ncbi:hypothetical protein [Bacillus sp. AFS088145]|uniref:hypothetical protein n=1 Tax=Bacillus sp. AFS088145 TaxID=2033514 RepID=UPI000BF4B21C|nr:hypothetical protein [Bacillus sp. AFS088145]PFH85837.1 hypothetical protein COI44_14640 [Bacillus sp. AFS088145]
MDEYLSWAEIREDFYISFTYILEVLVKLERTAKVEQLLNRYQHIFEEFPTKNEVFKVEMYLHYLYALALYRCARNELEEGLDELLNVANKAYELGFLKRFKECIQFYWEHRDYINTEHEKKYMELLNKA